MSNQTSQGAIMSATLLSDTYDLPPNWRVVRLGDVASVQGGYAFKSKDYKKQGIPIIRISNVKESGVDLTDSVFWDTKLSDSIRKFLLNSGDILISMTGEVGTISILLDSDVPSLLNQRVGRIVVRHPEIIDNLYLYYSTRAVHFSHAVKGAAYGAVQLNISSDKIEDIKIPLPPLPEQYAIAKVLQAVQETKEARQGEVTLERERKAALMQHLFTHGTQGEPCKQTEIGEIPESWRVMKLEEVAKIERGKFSHRPRNAPEFYGGDIPFIQTGDVTATNGHIRRYSQTLNEKGLAISKIFPKGTIVITIAANIGYTGILDFDSAFPDSLIGITPTEEVDNEFLNYYLTTQQPEMDRKAPRGTQKNINIEFLLPWRVIVPPLSEQHDIAGILDACDAKISALEHETALLDELFRSLLEELMTGGLSAIPLIDSSVTKICGPRVDQAAHSSARASANSGAWADRPYKRSCCWRR